MTQEKLKTIRHYDPLTGEFTIPNRKLNSYHRKKPKHKHRKISTVEGVTKPTTHWIWLYMTGTLPIKGIVIDHKNRNFLDNRFDNLRLFTQQENCLNNDNDLPMFIHKSDKYFIVYVYGKRIGMKKTLDLAVELRDEYMKSLIIPQ